MQTANILSYARQQLAKPEVAAVWRQYLSKLKKPATSVPVPTLWLEFAKYAHDVHNLDDLLPNQTPFDDNKDNNSSDEGEDDQDEGDEGEDDQDEGDEGDDDQDEGDEGDDDQDEGDEGEDDQDEGEDDEGDEGEDDQDEGDTEPLLESIIRRIARQEADKAVTVHVETLHGQSAPTRKNGQFTYTPVPIPITADHRPYWFAEAFELLCAGQPTLLVGPSGSGKTHNAKLLANALGLDFYPISFSAGIDESHLTGWLLPDASGGFAYVPSLFVTACEQGGLILADEFDAADPNVLLIWNAALANGFLSIPQRYENPIVYVHPSTRFIAAANTWGHGVDRQYVGRSQLDEATLSRFRNGQVLVDYDEEMERNLYHPQVTLFGHRLRARVRQHRGWTRDVSTRDIAAQHLKLASGVFADAEHAWYAYFQDWTDAELQATAVQLNAHNRTATLL